MKTRSLVTKAMALLMASAMVMGNTGMVVHASDDGCAREEMAAGGSSPSDGSDDIGGGSSSSSYDSYDDGCVRDEMAAGGSSASDGNDDIGGGSSSSSYDSYDDGCVRDEMAAGGSSASDGSDNIGSASYSAPAPKAAGVSASAGKEAFRAIAKTGAGTYKVMHKGVEVATFHLMDADKKAVACTAVALKLRDDGKYAINYDVADATGLTVGAPVDRTYMYKTLGVSYVTINDEVVIDIEAESAVTK